jgi:hypothetical protein
VKANELRELSLHFSAVPSHFIHSPFLGNNSNRAVIYSVIFTFTYENIIPES